MTSPSELADILDAWDLRGAAPVPVTVGNINDTFQLTTADGRWILQRVNPIFAPEVHLDIEAVTAHLARAGMKTPRLRRTRAGDLYVQDEGGHIWRVMTYIDGVNHSRAASPALCRAAGELLGRFHSALADLDHRFHEGRLGVHDTAKHLSTLRRALEQHSGHVAYAEASRMAESIFAAMSALPPARELPERVVHGDPKLNNIVFSPEGEAVCMIDLDTLATMPIPVELGDAFRSWCNPAGEDTTESAFEIELFAAGLEGYAGSAGSLLTAVEVASITRDVERITLELAARFCADVLNESYFGWDRRRYGAAWEHNHVRAQSQLELARSIAAQRPALKATVERVFGAGAS